MLGPRNFLVVLLAIVGLPGAAYATRIDAASHPALAGAIVEDFDGYSAGYFTSQTFQTGSYGFTVSALANDLHLDTQWCDDFGTSGTCLDTLRSNGQGNDEFDVVFTGAPVWAFGFDVNALDTDWTVQTFDVSNNLLSTYVISSQSPGLSGFDRRGYFGATETAPIQSFQVRSSGGDRALIDNFAFVPVPEPGTALLTGLGLMGLSAARGRRMRPEAAAAAA